MGLVGPGFVGGTAALAFLLVAEVSPPRPCQRSGADLRRAPPQHDDQPRDAGARGRAGRHLLILTMQALDCRRPGRRPARRSALCWHWALPSSQVAPACGMLGAPVSGWRWPLIWAAAAGGIVGYLATFLPEWAGAGPRRAGDPPRVRRGALDQGLQRRGPRAVPDEERRMSKSCRSRDAAPGTRPVGRRHRLNPSGGSAASR